MTQTPLTRLNLAGFSPKKARLVRKMEDHGWTGRVSSNGHAIMRCPDGETTCSVSPKMGSGRGLLNDEQTFKRWMREHGEQSAAEAARIREAEERQRVFATLFPEDSPAPVDTAPEPEPLTVDVAPEPEPAPVQVKAPVVCTEDGCGRVFATLQGMSVHRITHRMVACQFCGREMQPNGLGKHEATHTEELADPAALLREVYRLRADLSQARQEATDWERLADEAEERFIGLQGRARAALEALAEPDAD
jgi:hypothetical protein